MVAFALQPKGYAASLIYTPFDRTSGGGTHFITPLRSCPDRVQSGRPRFSRHL